MSTVARKRRPLAGVWTEMLVKELFRKSVVLLTVKETDADSGEDRFTPFATGFFVTASLPGTDTCWLYLVTALHVVVAGRPRGGLNLRLNIKPEQVPDGTPGYRDVPIDDDAWHEHLSTDVAIARVPVFPEAIDYSHVGLEYFATSDVVTDRKIGVGDEVFFAGLFTPIPGQERFQPIVRFGNVLLMPHEKVLIEIWPKTPVAVDAYLIEARSWGGHSGSPCFLHFPSDRHPGYSVVGSGEPVLLGLVSAHWPIKATPARDSMDSTPTSANSGIAVVIPAHDIAELFNTGDLMEDRKDGAAAAKRVVAAMDSPAVAESDSALSEVFTKDDFLGDLTKATRPIQQPEQEG